MLPDPVSTLTSPLLFSSMRDVAAAGARFKRSGGASGLHVARPGMDADVAGQVVQPHVA